MRDLLNRIVDGLDGLLRRDAMPDADRVWWLTAATIADLGRVSALWLEGWIGSQPAYAPGYGPDVETLPFVPVLADVNRAGFYTTGSQTPDGGVPGLRISTSVEGFADGDAAARLVGLLRGSGLVWSAWHQRSGQVERENWPWRGWRGYRGHEIENFWADCRPEAVNALLAGWQITVTDPLPGCGRRLWPLLTAFASDQPAGVDRLLLSHDGFGPPMTVERAGAVYDALAALVAAPPAERDPFVAAHTAAFLHRFRVPGELSGSTPVLCRHRHGDRLYLTTGPQPPIEPAVLDQVTIATTALDGLLGAGTDHRWSPSVEHFHREVDGDVPASPPPRARRRSGTGP